METRETTETMWGQATVSGRPTARAARWLDPDSLDVCAWADGVDVAADATDETFDRDDLATPPPPQTFQPTSQTQHRRPA